MRNWSGQDVIACPTIRRHLRNVPQWARTATYLVSSVGFPVAVAGWLLYRIAPILEQQTRLLERVL